MLCTKPWVMLMTQRFVCRPQEAGQSLEGRVSGAMHHAGVAITITSVTDFIAFAIGASSSLPILRFFFNSVCLSAMKKHLQQNYFRFRICAKNFSACNPTPASVSHLWFNRPLYWLYIVAGPSACLQGWGSWSSSSYRYSQLYWLGSRCTECGPGTVATMITRQLVRLTVTCNFL